MADLILPPSVRDLRGRAVEGIVNRLARIDLSPLLVYRIDTVPADALPFLAWQFDLLSPLWQLLAPANPSGTASAATSHNRGLIKLALALHRLRGTPSVIMTALEELGWENVVIQEGQSAWGGASWPSDEGWAVCRVLVTPPAISLALAPPWDPTGATSYGAGSIVSFNGLFFIAVAAVPAGLPPEWSGTDDVEDWDALTDTDLLVPYPWYVVPSGTLRPVSAADVALITAAFNFFKPARCWLDSVWFVMPPQSDSFELSDSFGENDQITFAEKLSVVWSPAADTIRVVPTHNRHWQHAGITYAKQPIGIVDGALVVNGQAEEGNN